MEFAAAQFLLHSFLDFFPGESHKFPCDYRTRIYAAYLKREKAKGRPFSKRTFFVYFLRSDFSWSSFWEWNDLTRNRWSVSGNLREKNLTYSFLPAERDLFWEAKQHREGGNPLLSTDIYFDELKERLKSIPKKNTLDLIKKLAEKEKSERARAFLRGILIKKCFYTYYERAGDPALFKIVNECRTRIFSQLPREPASAARSNRFGSCRPDT